MVNYRDEIEKSLMVIIDSQMTWMLTLCSASLVPRPYPSFSMFHAEKRESWDIQYIGPWDEASVVHLLHDSRTDNTDRLGKVILGKVAMKKL